MFFSASYLRIGFAPRESSMVSRVRVLIVAGIMMGVVAGLPGSLPLMTQSAGASWQEEQLDRLYLKNGRIVNGRIIRETDTEIEIEVVVAGIAAPTVFQKSDIMEIERAADVPDAPTENPSEAPAIVRESVEAPASEVPTPKHEVPEGATKVFYITMSGHLMGDPFRGIPYLFSAGRRDVLSYTPLHDVMQEAIAEQSDVIVVELNLDSPGGYEGLSVARPLQSIFEEAEASGARVVFWVQRAVAGAAFVSLMSEEIYFKPDGLMGGVGGIEDFKLGGDTVVDEKQISLRIGRAEGIAIQYGYNPVLVRAMMRKGVVLYVRFRGGKAQYLEHTPRASDGAGWELLTDDGKGSNKDKWSFEGNDYLNLDAPLARRLGVSDGTAATIDDLVYELDLGRDVVVIKGSGDQVLSGWQDRLARATDQVLDIGQSLGLDDLESFNIENTVRAKGQQVRQLQQVRSLVSRYAEVFDPSGDFVAQIDLLIERVRSAIRDQSRTEKSRNNNRGRRPR
jgi:hypothetical protein